MRQNFEGQLVLVRPNVVWRYLLRKLRSEDTLDQCKNLLSLPAFVDGKLDNNVEMSPLLNQALTEYERRWFYYEWGTLSSSISVWSYLRPGQSFKNAATKSKEFMVLYVMETTVLLTSAMGSNFCRCDQVASMAVG